MELYQLMVLKSRVPKESDISKVGESRYLIVDSKQTPLVQKRVNRRIGVVRPQSGTSSTSKIGPCPIERAINKLRGDKPAW